MIMETKTVAVRCKILQEREKAFEIEDRRGHRTWIPRSIIRERMTIAGESTIKMAMWLAEEKELDYDEVD